MNNIRIVSTGYLSEGDKLSYCPYCIKELEHEGKEYKDVLKPLKWVKTAESIQVSKGEYKDYFDKHYECSRCGNQRISPDTFSRIYGDEKSVLRAKGVPFEDITTVWNKELNCMVEAKWDSSKRKYVEVSQNNTEKVLNVN